MSSRGKIIVISGPSGTGKTSLYQKLLDEVRGTVDFSISATTRRPRKGEKNGRDYYFLERNEFEKKIGAEEFVEWAEVHGNYYGTLKSEIERIVDTGKSCLLDIDVQGGMNIKKVFPESVLIFIEPPSFEEFERRLRKRNTDDQKTIETRISNAVEELKYSGEYDYQIMNEEYEKAYRELKELFLRVIGS